MIDDINGGTGPDKGLRGAASVGKKVCVSTREWEASAITVRRNKNKSG